MHMVEDGVPTMEAEPIQHPSNYEALAAGRRANAEQEAARYLRQAFGEDDLKTTEVSQVDSLAENDISSPSPADLMALEGLGLSSERLLHPVTQDPGKAPYHTIHYGNESMVISPFGKGVTIRFTNSLTESDATDIQTPQRLRELMQQRFEMSPAHQALAHAREAIAHLQQVPEEVATEPFDPTVDPLGSLAFLDEVAFISSTEAMRLLRDSSSPEQALRRVMHGASRDQSRHQETETEDIYTWGSSETRELSIDKASGEFRYAVRQEPDFAYREQANHGASIDTVPFIETTCARELCSLLDGAGLMFNPEIQLEMMRPGEADRYGSVYTQLSREVAKMVNDPDRAQLSKLVVPFDAAHFAGTLQQQEGARAIARTYDLMGGQAEREEQVRTQWEQVASEGDSEPTQVFVTMIHDVLHRNPDEETASALPVTHSQVSMRGGACFDVANYYVQAASIQNFDRITQRVEVEAGVPMLEKRHGAHTFLSLEPITFNGVRLPKGALFSHHEDGWAFLRLTPFAFDNPEDQHAFGSEIESMEHQQREVLERLGGLTLHALSERSSRVAKD